MASDHLERLWNSIIPLSSLPKTRPDSALNASRLLLPPLTASSPASAVATTRRMQQELTQHRIEKLTERVDNIIEAVNQAKSSLMLTDGKLNGSMDKMLESTTTLVNRMQARILEAVGRPAQGDAMKDLLESQRDILGVIGMMSQQTTSLQANQANLQASLIALMSQSQQLSVQMSAIEQRFAQKLDNWKEDNRPCPECGSKRGLDLEVEGRGADFIPSKRRKSGGNKGDSTSPPPILANKESSSLPDETITSSENSNDSVGNISIGCSFPLNKPVDDDSSDSPLTPPDVQDLECNTRVVESRHNRIEAARTLGSATRTVQGRMTKAQKLASFLGDNSDEEEACIHDLFSGLG